jgi:hypothetical protein
MSFTSNSFVLSCHCRIHRIWDAIFREDLDRSERTEIDFTEGISGLDPSN